MSKMVKVIIVIGVILLIYQFLVNFLITSKEFKYSVNISDNSFAISEEYHRLRGNDTYSFSIVDKDNVTFVFDYAGNLNRQSRVIKDIKTFNKNNLYCIAPILTNNSIDSIVCKYNNELVTYNYLKQIGNNDVDEFINTLVTDKSKKTNTRYTKMNEAKSLFGDIYYYNGIDPKLYLTVWNYSGVYIINDEKAINVSILPKDAYENNYSIMLNDYYIVLNPENGYNHYLTNMTGGKANLTTDDELSNNIYFNGIYNNKAYFTDCTNQYQYYVDPYKEEIKQLTYPQYYDGVKMKTVDISYLTNEKRYFIKDAIPVEITNKYGNNVQKAYNNYYFIENGNVYKIIGKNYNEKLLLFRFNDAKELKALNNNVFVVSGDIVYMYNNTIGLQKAVEDRELIYNYKNIFNVYEKK